MIGVASAVSATGTGTGTAAEIATGPLDRTAVARRTARGAAQNRPAAARTGHPVRTGPDGTAGRTATPMRARGANLNADRGSATKTSMWPGLRCRSGLRRPSSSLTCAGTFVV
jgi:hypothetical protein